MDIKQALSQAEWCIRQNQPSQARTNLGEILLDDPQNEEAWILSAQVSDKPQQVIYCLRQAIKINPASSRARLLLDRLQLPPTSMASSLPSQPAPQPIPDTQPNQALPIAGAIPEETSSASVDAQTGIPASDDAITEIANPARSDYMFSDNGGNSEDVYAWDPGAATSRLADPSMQVAAPHRPKRWLQRVFIVAGSACLAAPWILIQNSDSSSRTMSGLEILLGAIFSSPGLDMAIASLALLACLILLILIFFRFQSAATQKWGERATIALAPLASVFSLEIISFFYAGLIKNAELRWGIWAGCAFYSLAGLSALINARRLRKVNRAELSEARAGQIFTWLFSLGDILVILATMTGLVLGKYGLIEIAIGLFLPFIWLFLGALLSHFV